MSFVEESRNFVGKSRDQAECGQNRSLHREEYEEFGHRKQISKIHNTTSHDKENNHGKITGNHVDEFFSIMFFDVVTSR